MVDLPTEVRTDTVSVGTVPVIEVDTFNGSITVQRGSSGVVAVEATLRDPDHVDYRVSQSGHAVTVIAEDRRAAFFGPSPGASILLIIPEHAELRLRSSNGAIEVTGIMGDLELDTSNGALRLTEVTGHVDGETSNGRITVSGLTGTIDARTSNGSISFSGSLAAGTEHELRTSNGSITVEVGPEANLRVDASTSNGDIAAEFPLVVERVSDDVLKGTIGDGSGSLRLSTSNGSITIR